ncbi:MAG: type 4a pilus biogenesis protein PilO [Opitutae bacterium]|nr:type 4a pilus biogenesis protein PilO [Opitutae bacterium]
MAISNEQVIAFVKKHPVALGCAVTCLGLLGTMYYRSDLVPTAEAELSQKTTQAERLSTNLKNAAQLKEQYDALSASVKQIEARLVHPADLARNKQYFYKLEAETGVKLLDLRQGTPTSKGRKTIYAPVPYTVSVQGDYAMVINFVRRLEKGVHYCRVLTASAAPVGAGAASDGGLGQVSLTLNLELNGAP